MKKIFIALFCCVALAGYGQDCITGNCFNGEGIKMYNDGSKFEGTFYNGMEAKGKLTQKNGDYRLGVFIPGTWKLEGDDCEIKQGDIFLQGTFKNDNLIKGRHKQGRTVWEGSFNEKGQLSGKGKEFLFNDKGGEQICEGNFKYGELEGDSAYIKFFIGDVYEGQVKNGLPHGNGMTTFPSGGTEKGFYFEGAFQIGYNVLDKVSESRVSIPLIYDSLHNAYYVELEINGTKFNATFDTGCSTLLVDKNYLYNAAKQGNVFEYGTQEMIDANDNIYTKDKLILGNIKIGEYEIDFVPVLAHKDGQGTSNLFGISALKRLGSVFILDFENKTLTVVK